MMRERVFPPKVMLTVAAASLALALAACSTPAAGMVDNDAGNLGRGQPVPIDGYGSAPDQLEAAPSPDDALTSVEVAAPDGATQPELGGSDAGPMEVTPQQGTLCAEEKVRDGIMFGFAGGPNFGDGKGVGLCGYPNALLPKGRFFGAVDGALFGNTAACGACVRIEDATGSVKVEIQIIDLVDPQLPGGPSIISADLAAQRMFSPAGNPTVKFAFVPCSVDGNIQTTFDTSTTTNSSLLVMNHRTALSDVQMMGAAGWRSLGRTRFNRWTIPFTINGQTNPMRFVDVYGRMIDVPAVPFMGNPQDTGAQFLPCLARGQALKAR